MKQILKAIGVAMLTLGFFGSLGNVSAHAASSKTTTPKAIRGTWYRYAGNNKFDKIKITTHTVTFNDKKYKPSYKGYRKLAVSKWGSWYLLNKSSSTKKSLGQFKATKTLIKGKYKKTLVRSYGVGSYQVFTTNKYKHKLTYNALG
ncbi:hypothetical protein [Lentilactobacillus sp. Marseille-Q4993]|uniref:hypothetical protein n=1 Tax=Lentilactobacillus sp. Marseille-Q4993 TaxID=3039492 RepID=UPI0024BCCCD9|nr:hypothetical protein [Lentilactobacillus sp. Marseille-Q4993]